MSLRQIQVSSTQGRTGIRKNENKRKWITSGKLNIKMDECEIVKWNMMIMEHDIVVQW